MLIFVKMRTIQSKRPILFAQLHTHAHMHTLTCRCRCRSKYVSLFLVFMLLVSDLSPCPAIRRWHASNILLLFIWTFACHIVCHLLLLSVRIAHIVIFFLRHMMRAHLQFVVVFFFFEISFDIFRCLAFAMQHSVWQLFRYEIFLFWIKIKCVPMTGTKWRRQNKKPCHWHLKNLSMTSNQQLYRISIHILTNQLAKVVAMTSLTNLFVFSFLSTLRSFYVRQFQSFR